MMTCDKCRHQPECFEQRGRCADFETWKQYRKRVRKEIEQLNENKETSSATAKSDHEAGPQ